MTRWWQRRSLRARLTVLATAVLALGLTVGTVGLAVLFAHGRTADLDRQLSAEASTVSGLVDSDQLTQPLPVPAGSPVLAQVVDSAGTVLASSSAAGRVLPLVAPADLDRLSRHGASTVDETGYGAGPLRVVVLGADLRATPVHVVVASSLRDVTGTVDALRRVLFVVVPLTVLAAGLSAWLAIGSALSPVEDLRVAATRIGSSGGGLLPVPPARDEIARLAATLNQMLGRIDASVVQQRNFAADAAHELRSPLAALITELEVALTGTAAGGRAAPAADHWLAAGTAALVDARRLAAIVDDLLLLSRTDAGQPLRRERVDLAAVVAGFADPETVDPETADPETAEGTASDPGARRVGVRLVVESGDVPAPVAADQAAIERAVRNLVDNARQHATGTVRLRLEPGTGGAMHQILVTDDGPGIPAAELDAVFDRFHRLDPSRARPGGTGLGLAIVRSIARAHGGDAVAESPPGGGALLRLSLPAAP